MRYLTQVTTGLHWLKEPRCDTSDGQDHLPRTTQERAWETDAFAVWSVAFLLTGELIKLVHKVSWLLFFLWICLYSLPFSFERLCGVVGPERSSYKMIYFCAQLTSGLWSRRRDHSVHGTEAQLWKADVIYQKSSGYRVGSPTHSEWRWVITECEIELGKRRSSTCSHSAVAVATLLVLKRSNWHLDAYENVTWSASGPDLNM